MNEIEYLERTCRALETIAECMKRQDERTAAVQAEAARVMHLTGNAMERMERERPGLYAELPKADDGA